MVWGVSRWTDGPFFQNALEVVFGAEHQKMPPEFVRDRGRIYFGADWNMEKLEADLANSVANLRVQFGWVEERLATGRKFMLGDAPGMPDALAWYLTWFIRGRWDGGPDFLSQFPNLCAWEERVKAIGHGNPTDMTSGEALEIARAHEPATPETPDPGDPRGLKPGDAVTVNADYGGFTVEGKSPQPAPPRDRHRPRRRKSRPRGDPLPGYRIPRRESLSDRGPQVNLPLIKAIVILPGTALVYVPSLIVWLTRDTAYAASLPGPRAIPGLSALPFGAAGLILMIWTMRLFTLKGGGGTPAPWEPIRNFIVLGPYRYVRNPMLTGVILFLAAEAILFRSVPVALWAALFFGLNTVYFMRSEEPQLEKRFGQAYRNYKREVPRWVPRLTPYSGSDEI